jgi:hypothetical protein
MQQPRRLWNAPGCAKGLGTDRTKATRHGEGNRAARPDIAARVERKCGGVLVIHKSHVTSLAQRCQFRPEPLDRIVRSHNQRQK